MKKVAVIHYDEIALKGGNRGVFESDLKQRIEEKLRLLDINLNVKVLRGRMFISDLDKGTEGAVSKILSVTPGVAYYGIGWLADIRDLTNDYVMNVLTDMSIRISQDMESWESYRISVKRANKQYIKTSQDIERELGASIYEYYEKSGNIKNVSLTKQDLDISVELLYDRAFVYVKKKGIGGLALGSSGKAMALLSGGFDSPVAAYMLAKRGVRPVAVHFHAVPKTSEKSLQKVRNLCEVLCKYTGTIELYLVPIVPAMQGIALEGRQDSLRLILLRRLMNKIAELLAEEVGAKALITGESVGQVASQTLENMRATAESVSLPLLRPLCGLNKQEIISLAKKIGTHDISAQRHDDTCAHFMPRRPETRAILTEVHDALKTYDEDVLIQEALKNITKEVYKLNADML